jgi:hypothetical protein
MISDLNLLTPPRVVCELGSKAKDLSGRNMLLTALDWIIPTHMSSRITTFKAAVNEVRNPNISSPVFGSLNVCMYSRI